MQFQTTEYLQKEITPAGRAYWKETRNRMKRKLLPSILVSMVFDILEVVLLVLISFLLQAFIDGVSETGSIDVTTTLILAAAIVIRTANTFFVNYLGWRLGLKGQELVSVGLGLGAGIDVAQGSTDGEEAGHLDAGSSLGLVVADELDKGLGSVDAGLVAVVEDTEAPDTAAQLGLAVIGGESHGEGGKIGRASCRERV